MKLRTAIKRYNRYRRAYKKAFYTEHGTARPRSAKLLPKYYKAQQLTFSAQAELGFKTRKGIAFSTYYRSGKHGRKKSFNKQFKKR